MSEILRWPDDLPAILRADTATFAERYADVAGSTACTSTLLAVFAKSPFVAEYAIRYPHEFAALLADPDLRLAKSNEAYAEAISAELAAISDNDAAKAALRRFRMREFVRIAWRPMTSSTMSAFGSPAESPLLMTSMTLVLSR